VLVAISHICDKHNLRVANIFHAGDGNLHPLVSLTPTMRAG